MIQTKGKPDDSGAVNQGRGDQARRRPSTIIPHVGARGIQPSRPRKIYRLAVSTNFVPVLGEPGAQQDRRRQCAVRFARAVSPASTMARTGIRRLCAGGEAGFYRARPASTPTSCSAAPSKKCNVQTNSIERIILGRKVGSADARRANTLERLPLVFSPADSARRLYSFSDSISPSRPSTAARTGRAISDDMTAEKNPGVAARTLERGDRRPIAPRRSPKRPRRHLLDRAVAPCWRAAAHLDRQPTTATYHVTPDDGKDVAVT